MSDTGGYEIKSPMATNYLLQAIIEAVRALKPAPAAENAYLRGALNTAARQRDEARAEVERLQAKVADDALTIAALRDENARLCGELDRHTRELQAEQGLSSYQSAELKRFREREAKYVEPLMRMVGRQITRLPDSAMELFKAVRDFKVTP